MSIVLDGFSRGVDTTRPAYAADPRTLAVLVNGHLTRGGDIEQRKAFVAKYACPGTIGLAQVRGQLWVFGTSPVRPGGLAAQVAYQFLDNTADEAAVYDRVLSVAVFADKLYVIVRTVAGTIYHFYDGELVEEWVDGAASGSFMIVAGSADAANTVEAVKVDGQDVLTAPVAWTTSHAATAVAVAAQITAGGTGFTGEAVGQQVIIRAPTADASFNGLTVEVVVTGDVATTLIAQMSGASGSDTAFTPGPFGITYGDKLYSVSGPRLHFSELFDPMTVKPNDSGAGYVDVTTSAEGADELIALAPYYSTLALLGRSGLQLWAVDADDAENERLQSIPDVDLAAPRAVQTWRDGGVLFLSRRGIKTLDARDSSGRGKVGDASLPIDAELVPYIRGLSAEALDRAFMLVEPDDGRLWLVAGQRVFVLSVFGEEGVSGWSVYETGRTFTEAVVADHRLYLRDGDTIYLHGGDTNAVYDAAPMTVRLQFFGGGGAASQFKSVNGIDIGAEGTWTVYLLPDYRDPSIAEEIATITGPTFDLPWHPAVSWSSHFSLELRRAEATRGTLTSVHIHAVADASR